MGVYKVRDYLTLTTWVNHCSWRIRDGHLLLWNSYYLQLSSRALVICAPKQFQSVFLQIFIQNVLYRGIFLLPLGMLLWTLLNSHTGDFKTCTSNLYVICSLIDHSFYLFFLSSPFLKHNITWKGYISCSKFSYPLKPWTLHPHHTCVICSLIDYVCILPLYHTRTIYIGL
jgi:hypothetical protein